MVDVSSYPVVRSPFLLSIIIYWYDTVTNPITYRIYIFTFSQLCLAAAINIFNWVKITSQQTPNICITFVQRRPNVFDVGPTLYKCNKNVLCLLGYLCKHLNQNKCQPSKINGHFSFIFSWTNRLLGYERVYLPLCEVADTPFHIQGYEIMATV